MGRRKGSRNKPRDPVASGESTFPSNGNGNIHVADMNDDSRHALLTKHCLRLEDFKRQRKAIDLEIKKERTIAKNEGFSLKAEVDHALDRREAMRTGRLGEILEEEIKRARVDRWYNIKPGNEPSLFDQDKATNDTAYQDGKIACSEGHRCIPPNHLRNDGVDSPHQVWIKGWQDMMESMVRSGIKPPNVDGNGEDTGDLRPTILKQREADGVYEKPPGGDAIDQLIQSREGEPPTEPTA